MPTSPKISVVIPVYDEEESLEALFLKIRDELKSRSYEIIFVDDGSRDGSFKVMSELHTKYPDIVFAIQLRKNFGKSDALDVGFRHSTGSLIFTMDADLQDDPSDIHKFLGKLEEGFDLISGWKKKRNDPWHKTFPSKIFNFIISIISGLKLKDHNCGFKLYRREVLENIRIYGELHRYIPILAHSQGFRIAQLVINHHPRKFGVSKFGIERFYRGFLDAITATMITRFSQKPMHFIGGMGLLLASVGGLLLSYFVYLKLIGQNIGFRPLFFLGILLFSTGLQLLFTGLLGELLVHLHSKTKEIHSYPIKKILPVRKKTSKRKASKT